MNFKDLDLAVTALFDIGYTPALMGDAGMGKTQFVEQYAKRHGFDGVINVRIGQMADAGDLKGLPQIFNDSTTFLAPDFLPRFGKYIIFFDEFNRTSKDLINAMFEMVLEGKNGSYIKPEECRIIVAGNEGDDYQTYDFDDRAWYSRFAWIAVEPSSEEWLTYQSKVTPDSSYLALLRSYPALIDSKKTSINIGKYAKSTRRTHSFICKLVDKGLPNNIQQELLIGTVGAEVAIAYDKFMANEFTQISGKDVLTDAAKIIKILNSKKVENIVSYDLITKVFDEMCVEYLKIEVLTKKQADNVIEFVKYLPFDFFAGNFDKLQKTENKIIKNHPNGKREMNLLEDVEFIEHIRNVSKTYIKKEIA